MHHADDMLRGIRIAMELAGCAEAVIGIKNKYQDVMDGAAAQTSLRRPHLSARRLPTPPAMSSCWCTWSQARHSARRPAQRCRRGVANVETLMNIGLDQPVTHKYLTVAGAVAEPVTLRVPIGITIGEVIEAAGGATVADFGVLLGGVMMAKPAADSMCRSQDAPAASSCCPPSHALIRATTRQWADRHSRPVRLRPVPLLHGVLPALSARPSH